MAFVPTFKVSQQVKMNFVTNNPLAMDNRSGVVTIDNIKFNEVTRSIEVTCSDLRMRQCRIDRLPNDATIKALAKALQVAYDKKSNVVFLAAGGASANVWFYTFEAQ